MKRVREKVKNLRRLRQVVGATALALAPEPVSAQGSETEAAVAAPEMDPLKFRLVERDGRRFFSNVRFNALHVEPMQREAVVRFFEGRELDSLRAESLERELGSLSILPRLQKMVADLKELFC